MPTYEYRCDNGHVFEVTQSMSDDPLTVCNVCEAPVQRVFHPVAVHFKGSGFYTTDYARKKSVPASSGAGSDGDKPAKNSSSSSDSKPETATSGKSGSDSD